MALNHQESPPSPLPENEKKERIPTLDEILKPLGGFGPFQIQQMALISVMAVLCAIGEVSYAITASAISHRCLIPGCETSDTAVYNSSEPWLKAAIPLAGDDTFEWCLRRNKTNDDSCSANSFATETFSCNSFVYETEEWTIVREDWDIHCSSDKWQLALLGSLNNVGQVVGSLFIGFASDRFGRKRVLVVLSILVSILGTIKGFSVNYSMMATMEVFEASLAAGLYINSFVLALEIVAPSKRVLAGTIISMAYPLGLVLLGGVQMATLDWRRTLWILHPPGLLIASYYWIVPESVRWLLTNQKNEEAVRVLKKIASSNKKTLSDTTVKKILGGEVVDEDAQSSGTSGIKAAIKDSFKSRRIRIRFLTNILVWIGIPFVYFGMTITSVNLSNNKFINFMLTGLIELPACILALFILDRLGRRICLSSTLIVCGICNIASAYVPDDENLAWLKLVLYLAGKFAITMSYMIGNIFTAEMFPTAIRAAVSQICLMMGKLATIAAPQIPVLGDVYEPLPLLIFSVFAFISGFTSLGFPETLHQPLPNTVEEAEQLGRKGTTKEDS